MTLRTRLSLAGVLAVLLSTSALWPVFDSATWVPRTWAAVLVVALSTALARRARLSPGWQLLVGLAALLVYLVAVFAGGTLSRGVLPTGDTVRTFRDLLRAAGDDLSVYGPPAPATRPLVLLVVAGVGLVALLVDALAAMARRPAAAGLPLLALFAVPSAVLPGGLGWLPFTLGAAGWLGLLLVEGREEAVRWGTPLTSAAGTDPAGLARVGRRIGGAALGVAVLVPLLVPGLDGRLLDGGEGGGSGAGNGGRSVTTYNPITRLRGELSLPEPVEVLRYRTDDPEPDYLRMTTLGIYDGTGWRQDVLRGNLRDNGVDDPVPVPAGVDATTPVRTVNATLDITSLDAFWLPVPATPRSVDVDGPWMWDAKSESVFATRSNTGKVEEYTVRSTRVLPDPTRLTAPQTTQPANVSPYATPVEATRAVRNLTGRVTQGQTTAYGKASAIQAFFRNPANGFTYNENTASGGSPDALQDFLRARQGFCEQYASAMAAMLRIAGVPSRVAVGFTPGDRQSDGTYVVTTDSAHAWPEAWIEGAGWVRFEPTPSQGGIRPPDYAANTPAASVPAGPAPVPTAGPEAATGADDALARRQAAADREAALNSPSVTGSASSSDDGPPLAALGIGALVVLLVASPSLVHVLRRRRRWRTPSATAAWEQLQDDATDSGHAWDPAETPRAAAARLVSDNGLGSEAEAAIGRLVTAVERERYAAPGAALPAGLAKDGATARRALHHGGTTSHRLRVALLPPSTMTAVGSWCGSRIADLLDAVDRLFSSVGRRVRRRAA